MKKRILPLIFFALLVGFSFGATLTWNELGPNNAGGKTRAVMFDNKDASGATIYAGATTGGIWRSTNLGLTWHEVNTQNGEVLRASSMVQTANGDIYVGTGEMSCNLGTFMGTGLYKSTDGENFTLIPGTSPQTGVVTSDWAYILKLVVAPNGRIFAATNTGLKYSDDGNTWTTALPGAAIDVEAGSDGTILAAVDNKAYISNADLTNFVDITTGDSAMLPASGIGWIEFAISPTDVNVMYVSLATTDGGFKGVYASHDKGLSWSIVFPSNTVYNPVGLNGCYSNTLRVSPTNPDKVYFGGQDLYVGTKVLANGFYNWEPLAVGTFFEISYDVMLPAYQHEYLFNPKNPQQFVIASDGGISIGNIVSGSPEKTTFKLAVKGYTTGQFKTLDPSIYKTAVLGSADFLGVEFLPGDMSTLEPKTGRQFIPGYPGHVAWSNIKTGTVFFETGPASGIDPIIRSEDMGATISPTFMEGITLSGTTPLVLWENFNFTDSRDSLTVKAYAADYPVDTIIILKSNNGAFPIHYKNEQLIHKGDSVRIQDPVASRLFLWGNHCIMMTKQAETFTVAPSWFKIAYTGFSDNVTCMSVTDDLKAMWVGTSNGHLYRITDITFANDSSTANYDSSQCVVHTKLFDSIPGIMGRNITSVSVSKDDNTVLVTLDSYGFNDYVYLTKNGLDSVPTFSSIQGNLPPMPVNTSIIEMTNQNKAIIGTDNGAYSSDDITAGTVAWVREYNGVGNVPVMDIVQQTNPGVYYMRPANYGYIYMATYGRGIFMDSTHSVVLGVDPVNGNPSKYQSLNVYPNPFRNELTVNYTLSNTTSVNISVFDLAGKKVASVSEGNQNKGEYTKTLNLSSLPMGTYLIRLESGIGNAYGKAVKVN